MGIFDRIASYFNIPSPTSLDEKLKADLEKYIEAEYGKPYVTVEEKREQKQKLRAEQLEKARKEKLAEEAKKKQEKKEEKPATKANSDTNANTSVPSDVRYSAIGTDVKYSLSMPEDREALTEQANSYYNYAYKGMYDLFTPTVSFKEQLLSHIIASGMDNVAIYKRANLSKSVFSSIMTNTVSVPKKSTVIALAIALRLSLEETERLLMKAGYTFSNSIKGDLVAVYFITHKIYDIDKLNIALHDIGEPLLGSKLI